MVPTSLIELQMMTLLGNDTTTLAPPADGCLVHLIVEPFTPGPGVSLAALTEASFAGGEAKEAGVGPQTVFTDPETGNIRLLLLDPAGGWTWVSTAAPDPEQVVYGYCVTDNAETETYGSDLLPDGPVTINGSGQGVQIGEITIDLPPGLLGPGGGA